MCYSLNRPSCASKASHQLWWVLFSCLSNFDLHKNNPNPVCIWWIKDYLGQSKVAWYLWELFKRQDPSQQYFSGPIHWAIEYRSPCAQPIGKQFSIARKSLSLSDMSAPAANSSRWETDRVPGMGNICSPWCKSHAMASEAVLCPISLASNRNWSVAAMLRL